MRSRLIAAWFVATAIAVALAYSAVGLVQDQVTERGVVLAVVDVSTTTTTATRQTPNPSNTTLPEEDPTEALPAGPDIDTDPVDDDSTSTTTLSDSTTSTVPTTVASSTSTSSTTTSTPPETIEYSIPSDGGAVIVLCTGQIITFERAKPSSGFEVEVKSEGPDEVRVSFEDDDDHEFEIRATCTDGAVDSRVDSSG